MKIIKNVLPITFFTSTLVGCAAFSPRELAEPSNLEISTVLQQIGQGFSAMKKELGDQQLGIWPCKITTALNITASAAEGGKLVLDTTVRIPIEPITADITLNAEQTNSSSASRGNVINIEMYNPGCFPKDTVAYQLASIGSASSPSPTNQPGSNVPPQQQPNNPSTETSKNTRQGTVNALKDLQETVNALKDLLESGMGISPYQAPIKPKD